MAENPYASPLQSDSAETPTHVRWGILALLMAYAGLCHFNRTSISVAGTEHLMPEYSLTETQMGLVYSSYLTIYALCMIPGGWLIDRFGPMKALLFLGFGSALLVPLTGSAVFASTASMLLVLCVIRAMLGFINTPMHPAAARSVSFWFPVPERSLANGFVTGAAVTGVTLTYFVFGFLMDRFGWPLAFVVAGFVTLLLTAAWLLYATDRPREHRGVNAGELSLIEPAIPVPTDSSGRSRLPGGTDTGSDGRHGSFLSLLFNRSLVFLTLSYAALSYFQYLFFYWVQNYFDKVLPLEKLQARLFATIPMAAMVVGMILGGWLADRARVQWGGWLGRAIMPMCGLVGSALLLLVGIAGGPPVWVVTCFALATASLGACESSFWVTGIELGRKRGGLSGAILNAGGNAGGILGVYFSPLVSYYFNWQVALGLASFLCLVGAVLWCGIRVPSDEPVS